MSASNDRLLDHVLRVLAEHLQECRRNGVRPPPRLVALCGLLASERLETTEFAVGEPAEQARVMNFDQVAQALAVSRRSVERLAASGALPVVEVLGLPRVRCVDLDEFVVSLPVRAAS